MTLENEGQKYILRKLKFERISHKENCATRNIKEFSTGTREIVSNWNSAGHG